MKFEKVNFVFKGIHYQVNDEYCNRCKADCGRNYCVDNCSYIEEVGIDWNCPICNNKNNDKASNMRDEYIECINCKKEFAIEVNNKGEIESITEN